jgi:hypothetical protein
MKDGDIRNEGNQGKGRRASEGWSHGATSSGAYTDKAPLLRVERKEEEQKPKSF